ncbi:hypothetical protein [Candidatus Uabimicrobium amorphum]|uniref:Lipoprotein n=2 Tax=Uabimicrobium amorphum TaxID=2596890 RepID=A0A5S9IUB8_UABAM|nr:hypothetical protein UABAM_06709 [Candidatus Uabimicrobium amorphum]
MILRICIVVVFFVACETTQYQQKQYAEAQKRTLYFVVHETNPCESVTIKQLKKFYLGKKGRWDHLVMVKRYDYPPLQKAFYEQVLQMTSAEVSRYWNYQKFMAGPARPFVVARAKDLLAILQKEPGGIGYVTTKNIPKNLKIVAQFDVIRE